MKTVRGMVRVGVSVLALMALFACATPEPEAPPPPPPPPQIEVPPPLPPEPVDTCGAKPLQSLIGKPKSAIPVPVDPTNRRVTCSTCAVTMDYNPQRLNIIFDTDTGIVTQVKCG